MNQSTDVIIIYDALIAEFPDVERKGKTTPYTSTNTYMSSFIGKEGILAFRLSANDIDVLIETHDARLMTQHGKTMKDFVAIPTRVTNDNALLKHYFQKSIDHTNGLKPKKK
ncbi:MAG: hypothetical protein ACI9JN_002095 [Bacteroidia bacterium]|jgi:hypothetical protein